MVFIGEGIIFALRRCENLFHDTNFLNRNDLSRHNVFAGYVFVPYHRPKLLVGFCFYKEPLPSSFNGRPLILFRVHVISYCRYKHRSNYNQSATRISIVCTREHSHRFNCLYRYHPRYRQPPNTHIFSCFILANIRSKSV